MSREYDPLIPVGHGDPQCSKKNSYMSCRKPRLREGTSILTMNDGKASVHEAFHVL